MLKGTEVKLGVSVPPLLDEPNAKETVMVAVTLEFAVEVRVTVSVYVWPGCIPVDVATRKYNVVGVVNAPE
jgi:hypothetical protein